MSKQYSAEFKEQAVKRVLARESSAKVARPWHQCQLIVLMEVQVPETSGTAICGKRQSQRCRCQTP